MTQRTDSVEPPLASRRVQQWIAWLALLGVAIAAYRNGTIGTPSDAIGSVTLEIDLNEATERELSLLPGVGMVLAKRIAEDRDRLGPFGTTAEIGRVHGVGEKSIEQISRYLIVDPSSVPPSPARIDPSPARIDPSPARVAPSPARIDPSPARTAP